MALAIVVCNAFINAGLPAFTGSYADWAQTLIYRKRQIKQCIEK